MIRRATYDDILWVIQRLQKSDLHEANALGYRNKGLLVYNALVSQISLVASEGTEPISIFGAHPIGEAIWNAWMFSSEKFNPIIGRTVKRSFQKDVVPQILSLGGTFVQAVSVEGNSLGRFFIEKLGGVQTHTRVAGSNGETLIYYLWNWMMLSDIARGTSRDVYSITPPQGNGNVARIN